MSHVRRQIREAIGDELLGLTTTGARVFQSRVHPVAADSLPCILIYATQEELLAEASAMGGKRGYLLRVAIEVRARPVDDVDDMVDQICAEVQAALGVTGLFSGLLEDLDLYSTEIGFDAEAESPTGWARMIYGAIYRIAKGDPETALP